MTGAKLLSLMEVGNYYLGLIGLNKSAKPIDLID